MNVTYMVSGIMKSVFFENTALALRSKGYKVNFILLSTLNNEMELFLKANDFNYTYLKVNGWRSYPKCVKEIRQFFKITKPDIVHTHLTTANLLGLIAAELSGVKLRVFTGHTGQVEREETKLKIYNYIILRVAEYAIAITSEVKRTLISKNFKAEKIEVIHHGFNLARFGNYDKELVVLLKEKYATTDKYPVIGCIARTIEMKGIQYTVRAFKKLLEKYPKAKLCLFNYSPFEDYSKQLNMEFEGLPPDSYVKVQFENNVYDLYRLFDIFVHLPTDPYYEAFGQTYIESLASEVPSIFTLSGIANDFIIHEENAIVVNYRNSDEVYEGMIRLLENKELAQKLIENGKRAVNKSFSFDAYINKLDNFYKKIFVENKRKNQPYIKKRDKQ